MNKDHVLLNAYLFKQLGQTSDKQGFVKHFKSCVDNNHSEGCTKQHYSIIFRELVDSM